MAKPTKAQHDEDEMKVLSFLKKNCNERIDSIAEHCGLSKQKVRRIIKQLEQRRTIWGYSAVGDEPLELQKFILFIKRTREPHDPNDVQEIITTHLESMKEDLGIFVQSSYVIHGEYDWVTIFTAKDIMVAKKFVEAIMQRFPRTQHMQLSQILFTFREQYILNPNTEEMIHYI